MSDFDWLDDDVPKRKQIAKVVKSDPHYRELETAFNGIKGSTAPRKKLYLLCYLQASYDPRVASQIYQERIGEKPKVAAWRKDENFQNAIELAESAVYRALGISTASVLAMTREALDKARDSNDPQATARFLEMLGKHLKLWTTTDEQSSRVGPALNINILAPEKPEVKRVTDDSVTIDIPRPDNDGH